MDNQVQGQVQVQDTGVCIPEDACSSIRIADKCNQVHKTECIYSYDTPDSETGLYVSLVSFLGFGRDYVERYAQHTGNKMFLHIRREKIPIPNGEQQGDGPKNKITRLAIGVEGGFDPDSEKSKFKHVDHYAVVVLPDVNIPWPNDNLPDIVKLSVQSIIDAESATKMLELDALAGTWDGEVRSKSIYADHLSQLDNGIKIPPSGWQCNKCDLTTNLWLNLTDGSIMCGRKFFDGSGGNDHAYNHFLTTGYPLAVKLGTITADGEADVFSYAEDDMVKDTNLRDHLMHWGIDIQNVQKTEKSMIELELEMNQRAWEWGALQESSSNLQLAYGPGLTGLTNLGNSCYLNSVMQVIFTIPDFVKRFVNEAPSIFNSFPNDPANNFNVQMAKLGMGLLSGKYSIAEEEGSIQKGIAPLMFKSVIGKGSRVFSSKQQQDVVEYYQHLLCVLEHNSRHIFNPSDALKINVEDRIQCGETGGVRYTNRTEYYLPFPVPLAAADNIDQVNAYENERKRIESMGQKMSPEALVRPHIPFSACLNNFVQEEKIEQYFSTAANKNVTAIKRTRLANFPDYLFIQLKKFTIQSSWVPIKLDVEVDMPWELDINALKGNGLQDGEILLPELSVEVPPPVYDEQIMAQLREMNFPVEGCKRALFFTKNAGLEPATQWIMDHMTDDDFEYPFYPPGTTKSNVCEPNEDDLQMVMAMGFSRNQAIKALKATSNNVERAVDWIFSHAEELDADTPEQAPQPEFRDGNSKYKLVGFISHMGTSINVGHYVCHILHNDRWVIFNDEKVAYSENPPKNLGYVYLYKRL